MSEESASKEFQVNGQSYVMSDHNDSFALKIVADESNQDNYGIKSITFEPGDVVLDIGAHVGGFCIPLFKAHPDLVIYALEPQPDNFFNLVKNIRDNQIDKIKVFPWAVSAHGKLVELYQPKWNTAAATSWHAESDWKHCWMPSVTLDDFWKSQELTKVKLLKLDCEGAEYAALPRFKHLTDCEYLRAEFHIWKANREHGCDMGKLKEFCNTKFKPGFAQITGWIEPGITLTEKELAEGFVYPQL